MRAKRIVLRIGILALLLSICSVAMAQTNTNSWTKSVGGNWEELYWSLGILPNSYLAVALTNAGWKALAIGANTAQNFPESLYINSLTISSPTNSFNTLLLNFVGFQTPLVTGGLVLGSNSAVTVLSSALIVHSSGVFGRYFSIGGMFIQGANARVTTDLVNLGDIGPGTYDLTNGTLTASGEFIGQNFPARFTQWGGTNSFTMLRMYPNAQYELHGGLVNGNTLAIGYNDVGAVVLRITFWLAEQFWEAWPCPRWTLVAER